VIEYEEVEDGGDEQHYEAVLLHHFVFRGEGRYEGGYPDEEPYVGHVCSDVCSGDDSSATGVCGEHGGG